MRMRTFPKSSTVAILVLVGSVLFSQDASYLTQKLMVEKDIHERVTTALSKLMRPSQFVVQVSVDLELSDAVEEQVTFAGDTEEAAIPTEAAADKKTDKTRKTSTEEPESGYMGGLPIPGFEFEVQPEVQSEPEYEPEIIPEEVQETPVTVEKKEKILSRTASRRRPAIAHVIRKSIHVILQEDTPPELLENVRTIVTATAGLNVQGGDNLTLTTASFKERREAKKAEQILLQSIADKLQNLEDQQQQKNLERDRNWEEELKRYREEEAKRREEDRQYFKQQLAQLETAARERAFQEEKRRILRQDSIRIQQLDAEIARLREQITETPEDSQKVVAAQQLSKREAERNRIDQLIEEKLQQLDAANAELDQMKADMNKTPTMTMVLIAILGSLLLILLIVLIFVLMNRPRQVPYPPMMMPPPRRRKRKPKKPTKETPPAAPQPTVAPQQPQPTPPATPAAPSSVEDDPAVLSSEISDMRQAVVSMSVGQPHTATRIVKEWMQQEAPPPPPEPETPAPEPEEEDTGKKKRKK